MSFAKKVNNKIYIAGPMTGLPNYNFDAFDRAAEMLRTRGLEPVNPADNGRKFLAENGGREPNWEEYRDLLNQGRDMLRQCSKIYLLKGWENSKGAIEELSYALIMHIKPEVEK